MQNVIVLVARQPALSSTLTAMLTMDRKKAMIKYLTDLTEVLGDIR